MEIRRFAGQKNAIRRIRANETGPLVVASEQQLRTTAMEEDNTNAITIDMYTIEPQQEQEQFTCFRQVALIFFAGRMERDLVDLVINGQATKNKNRPSLAFATHVD